MPLVSVELDIQVPIETVWERVIDFPSYPQFMANVDWAEEKPSRGQNKVTSWQARLKGSILRWTDESVLYKDDWRVEFFQLDGDLERFDGFWQLKALGEQMTRVRLSVDFEVGIPQLRSLLNPAAGAAITENCESMLHDLEQSSMPREQV